MVAWADVDPFLLNPPNQAIQSPVLASVIELVLILVPLFTDVGVGNVVGSKLVAPVYTEQMYWEMLPVLLVTVQDSGQLSVPSITRANPRHEKDELPELFTLVVAVKPVIVPTVDALLTPDNVFMMKIRQTSPIAVPVGLVTETVVVVLEPVVGVRKEDIMLPY